MRKIAFAAVLLALAAQPAFAHKGSHHHRHHHYAAASSHHRVHYVRAHAHHRFYAARYAHHRHRWLVRARAPWGFAQPYAQPWPRLAPATPLAAAPFAPAPFAPAPLAAARAPVVVRGGAGAPLAGLVARHAAANGVPASLIHRVIMRESRYNARAVSRGNYGLMQIRLGTARAMGYSGSAAGLLDPNVNMTYAVRYLAGAYRAAGGNASRAVMLYARGYGAGRVHRHGV